MIYTINYDYLGRKLFTHIEAKNKDELIDILKNSMLEGAKIYRITAYQIEERELRPEIMIMKYGCENKLDGFIKKIEKENRKSRPIKSKIVGLKIELARYEGALDILNSLNKKVNIRFTSEQVEKLGPLYNVEV